ncbi:MULTISPECIES: class I adenylate-forming enzyme family protein [Streptomyces]|uniref:class I adenylate-forming enzyme family protein n=1 Tax=Streptomyces TaxID=1883 RepID=UPI001CCAC152|nr:MULTISPECIES: class I adenylate-forming enzyme family protein [Streptomyces]UBI40514.1 acyl--CoA ligase [Streptomyces mobaraensis]UKW33096.1 acyl--CoA ligase [Streptomyces sp. TYQ1024]
MDDAPDTPLDVLAGHRRAGRGDRPALADRRRSVTYAELERDVGGRMRELGEAGIGAGVPVGVVLTCLLESVADFAAALSLGAAVLVLQERAGGAERAAALDDFGAELLVTDGRVERLRTDTGDAGGSPAFAVASSGTGGRPKVISREWPGTFRNSAVFAAESGLDADDVVLTTSPLGHSYAIEAGTLAVLAAGACQVVPSGPLTPARAAALAERHRPSVLQTVPLVLDWWGRGGVPRAGRWKRCVSAGEALPAAAAAPWHDAGVPVLDHYGNSELGQLTLGPAGDGGGVGRPLPGVGLRAGTDGPGPVTARFPGLSPVRMRQGRPTPLADADGWVATGDLGVLDADGGLRLTGRADALINVAGNKVSPTEVEAVLRGLPGVGDCAVVGRPGPAGGTQVWAFVEADARDFDAAALRRRAGELLTPVKVPSVIRRVDALPRTPSGKIRRGPLLTDDGG